ncbi:MAG: hypothetical protein DMF54_01830 [Acidobacteria bacterium]|nr:MAG: hypothetical protein DMF54_01830 [Acidobacteriota bacterium]
MGARSRKYAGQRPGSRGARAGRDRSGPSRRADRAGPRQGPDRGGTDGGSPRGQRGQRPTAGVHRRRVSARKAPRHRGSGRKRDHVRFRRDLDQAGRLNGRNEVRHDGSGRLPIKVVALAPVTENLPSGSATRPGDILRFRNGKTVEVDNTDAEGRLVLADALAYAAKFRPDVILDFATLTGAVLIALGHECAALFTDDEKLATELLAAGEARGERLWRLPLWDDYRENLRSEWADMKNTAGRTAGTIGAAVFLKEFVPKEIAWAHIDIAGVAHFEKEHAGYAAGATGFGVALTMDFLKRRFGTSSARGVRPRAGAGKVRRRMPRGSDPGAGARKS